MAPSQSFAVLLFGVNAVAAGSCTAGGVWYSIGSIDTINVTQNEHGKLRATAASHGFVDVPGRVHANDTLLFLDIDGGMRGIFLEHRGGGCEEIAWADKSATRWSRSRTPVTARAGARAASAAIDRRAVVARYPLLTGVENATLLDPTDVFTLGNGDFVFNVDATGLQTFNTTFTTHGPKLDLNTLSSWAFHSTPACPGDASAALRAFNYSLYSTPVSATDVRPIPLATDANLTGLYSGWSMSNPHRVGLGQISLRLLSPGASDAPEADSSRFQGLRSSLDTWGGSFSSSFTIIAPSNPMLRSVDGSFAVAVDTTVHPDVDLVATRLACVRTAGTQGCPTALRLALPYADGSWGASANNWDPTLDARHQTDVIARSSTSVLLMHYMDDFQAEVRCDWDDPAWALHRVAPHAFTLAPPLGEATAIVQLSCLFAPAAAVYPVGNRGGPSYVGVKAENTLALLRSIAPLPLFAGVRDAAALMWAGYWTTGAFVDLAGATGGTNENALELERRVILSKYLTRANSAGMTPPQETGLLSNSWSGRFHLEMRWWHQSHFPLWGQPELLDRSHAFYWELLENATSLATQQGFRGARWQKMLGLANRANRTSSISVPWLGEPRWSPPTPDHANGLLLLWESANKINPVLTWNQGPVIWLADAIRRSLNASQGANAALAAVHRLAPLVAATADCIADMPFMNESSGFFELGPPTLGAEEFGDFMKIRKPTWETVYFAYVLDVANEWRELQGLARDAHYDAVAAGLGGLALDPAQAAPTYSFNAEAACCYNRTCPPGRFGGRDQCSTNGGHPSPAAVLGLLNGRRFGDRYGVDQSTANNMIAAIANNWDWSSGGGWGWDNPLVALGQIRNAWDPNAVVAMLLMNDTHNGYWRTGWNWQGGFTYLPGNGGTLSAVAMMAGGTDTSPACNFPKDWGAVCEGFILYP
jgi:hypothetical protein